MIKALKKNEIKEGDKFKLKDKNEYLVYIDNNHNWFYVNSDLYKTFNINEILILKYIEMLRIKCLIKK